MSIELLNMNCMDFMAGLPDKAFDLAIVDPPYGIGRFDKPGSFVNRYGAPGKWNAATPCDGFFDELARVAARVIVFGGNYFDLPKTGGWLFWDKEKNSGEKANFADGELAWTNFLTTLRIIRLRYDGFVGADPVRIHPAQKPIKLYEQILGNYAKPGQRILDTHLGSGSSAIAAHNLGFDFVGMELDADYYAAACKRFEQHKAQGSLFIPGHAPRCLRTNGLPCQCAGCGA